MESGHIGKKIKTYTFNRLLGKGAWASVFEVYDQVTGVICACKVIAKKLMVETPKLKELVQSEITVLKRCKSQNVIGYVDSFSTEKQVFIITEYCNGGDVEEYLAKKKRLTEDEALQFLRQILNGFKGLHEIGALHRDFKTANILLHNKVAKIADLGFSKILKGNNITGTILGTSVTMAPQLLDNKKYGRECDVWSVGVVYYQLVIGDYPYNGYNDREILKKIKSYPPRFPESIEISKNSKDFINRCLTVDPKKRISWLQIYDHPLVKINNPMGVGIGSLMSKIDFQHNKAAYTKEVQLKPIQENDLFKKTNQLVDSTEMDIVQREVDKKKIIEKTITNYAELYLQRRSIIMLTIKYGISLIYQLQRLPFDQNAFAFLISKRAYLEIRDLRNSLTQKRNPFNLKINFDLFLKSSEYAEITKQVISDFEFISVYAQSFVSEINPNNKEFKKHLSLQTFDPEFNALYKQKLSEYTYQLYDNKDNPKINKSVLLRLMTFVFDLVQGIMVSFEDYERKMQSLDQKQMEINFAKKQQGMMKKYL